MLYSPSTSIPPADKGDEVDEVHTLPKKMKMSSQTNLVHGSRSEIYNNRLGVSEICNSRLGVSEICNNRLGVSEIYNNRLGVRCPSMF